MPVEIMMLSQGVTSPNAMRQETWIELQLAGTKERHLREREVKVLLLTKYLLYKETWPWPARILCSGLQIRKSSNFFGLVS